MIDIQPTIPKLKLPPQLENLIKSWSRPLARKFPDLRAKLEQANMDITPETFLENTLKSALPLSIGLIFLSIIILGILHIPLWFLIIIIPAIPLLSFFYLMQMPITKMRKVEKEVDQEIVYAGRFLLIELTAGVPLYNALENVSNAYGKVGKYFAEITRKIESGTPTERALDEVIEATPSENLRKLLWQINNSLRTGSDLNTSLSAIIEQIAKEQLIKVQEYARKLNPLVMFYLMLAIILPSLGITMLALLSTFIKISLGLGSLIGVAVLIGIIQFGFFAAIKSARPGVGL